MKKSRHLGTYRSVLPALVAAISTAPFFIINGVAGKRVRLKRIIFSGVTTTAVEYNSVVLSKYSTAPTAGTAVAADKISLDSSYPAATAAVNGYTAAPTAGTLVGALAGRRFITQATTAAAAGIPTVNVIEFDDDDMPVLNSAAENLGLRFSVNPASAATMNIEAEFEEESIV